MKLEDEIKQKSFGTPHRRMLVNVMFTGNWLQKELASQLKPHGLSLQQHNVLGILRGQYPTPATLGLIQERMLDRDSNATRLVDKLLEKGLVTRCQCSENRRKVDIIITEKGLELLQLTDFLMQNLEEKYPQISPEEATQIGDFMDKLREKKS
ncbi:MarR family winged helix-turn-helix transcriptional regulator [Rufibacter glacialis]|uniref:MarR family transcriptional regulator n=1 Tax=Rufibacter glacialis TaxID=1259555 RepID=A0A5M8QEL5_9BACT|nr:MarR family transcriptional regulator [Rufibacter glacialis]KAA6433370.1 MarR family transcriptional regulator [Rufibacter glacialis]GGK74819.1 MarR family transcriptional regulator [Rufibacter glacialis]